MKLPEVRKLFPAVAKAAYLNAAAASPLATPVHRAVCEHYDEAMEWGDVGFTGWLKRKEEARAKVALAAGASPGSFYAAKLATARFYFQRLLPEVEWAFQSARSGARNLFELEADAFDRS